MRRIGMRRPSARTALLLGVWGLFCAWVIAGWWSVRSVREPSYDVVARYDGYEVRTYGPFLAVQVSATAPWSEAFRRGRALLAGYLNGDNTTQESIAAGRPVGMEARGQDLGGGVPFLVAAKNDAWTVSFPVPVPWTEVTLPRPNDPRIRIVRVPSRTMAVLTFSGSASRDRADEQERSLRALLARDGAVILGPATVAQYHPSWAPPFLRRNELIIPVRQ